MFKPSKYALEREPSFKSKYKSVSEMVKDRGYCKWLFDQTWFKKRLEYDVVREALVFGNYEYIEEVIKDRKHCKWLCDQTWFKTHEWYTLLASNDDSVEVKQIICNHEWIKGKYIERFFYSCDRMYCRPEMTCCFKSGYEFECSKCQKTKVEPWN